MKPVILQNREIACISKTADPRDLGPCLNDSEGPILGGVLSETFCSYFNRFCCNCKKGFSKKGEISPTKATGIEFSLL